METDSGDVWDDETGPSQRDVNAWEKMKAARRTEGYKDGFITGEESKLQEGFNVGYKKAVHRTIKVAKLRGLLTAVIFSIKTGQPPKDGLNVSEWIERAEELIQRLKVFETDKTKKDTSQDSHAETGGMDIVDEMQDWQSLKTSGLTLLNQMNVPVPDSFLDSETI